MKLAFTKMHGCGNDYIYFNCFEQQVASPESLSVALSDRHFGVGGDGVVLIEPSDRADARMRIFNRDGSEALMCGNAIRCVGKFLYDRGMTHKTLLTVDTLSGVKSLELFTTGGEVTTVRVDMGRAELTPERIPVSLLGGPVVAREVVIGGVAYEITCVSMGNPHCVVFSDEIGTLPLAEIGPLFESAPIFPERVNAEFVQVIDSHTLKMRVWERGSGETMACGTGACAAAVAAVENRYCLKGEDILVKLLGGDLIIRYTDETVFMTGEAQQVFDGLIEIREECPDEGLSTRNRG